MLYAAQLNFLLKESNWLNEMYNNCYICICAYILILSSAVFLWILEFISIFSILRWKLRLRMLRKYAIFSCLEALKTIFDLIQSNSIIFLKIRNISYRFKVFMSFLEGVYKVKFYIISIESKLLVHLWISRYSLLLITYIHI